MARVLLVAALLLAVTVCVSAQCSSYRNCAECASQGSCNWCQKNSLATSTNEYYGACISTSATCAANSSYPVLVTSRSSCYSNAYANPAANSYLSCATCSGVYGYSWCSSYPVGSSSAQYSGMCTTAPSSYCRYYGASESSNCYSYSPDWNYNYSSTVNSGAIAGLIIGAVFFFIFVVLLVRCMRRRAIYRAQSALLFAQQPAVVVAAQPPPVYVQQPVYQQPYQPPQYAPGQPQTYQAYPPQGYAAQGNPQQPQAYARMA